MAQGDQAGVARHHGLDARSPNSTRGRRLPVVCAVFLLLISAVAASALADESESTSHIAGFNAETAEDGILDATNGIFPDGISTPGLPTEAVDPTAAAGVPLGNLNRSGAIDVLTGVFTGAVDAASGPTADLDIQKFLSDNVAVVSTPDSTSEDQETDPNHENGAQTSLVAATLPLRTEKSASPDAAVDLTLERGAHSIEPSNPLVEVSVPNELGDGIALPEVGVEVHLEGAPAERAPSVTEETIAFFPEVAEDSDFAVAPTLTGVETLTQIRSAAAPKVQTFSLDMPAEAALVQRQDGAEVLKNGQTLVSILPPTAMDAEGASVPISLDVADSHTFSVTVAPKDTAAYPILVDPVFQSYEWKNQKSEAGLYNDGSMGWWKSKPAEQWAPDVVTQPGDGPIGVFPQLGGVGLPGLPFYEKNPPGLHVWGIESTLPGQTWDHGAWVYSVPRFYSDLAQYGEVPRSYISHMWLSQVYFKAFSPYLSPYFVAGLWRAGSNPGWRSIVAQEGLNGHHLEDMNYMYDFSNDNAEGESADVKQAMVGLFLLENIPKGQASIYAGYAAVELSEPTTTLPKFGTPLAGPSEWVDTTAKPIEFVVSDAGLGAYSVTATTDQGPALSWKTLYGCTGAGAQPCPHTWSWADVGRPALAYEPAKLPNGINKLSLTAQSPLGRTSAPAKVQVKVDHTKPYLAPLSGSLTEQASIGSKAPQYQLSYSATDGDSAAAAAQAPFGSAGAGVGQIGVPNGVAIDANGNVFVADQSNNKILKFDSAGNYLSQFGSTGSGNGQLKEPRGVAIGPNGDIWVADAGNHRIQCFTSSGLFKSAFTAGGQLVTPYGIAVVNGTGPLSGQTLVVASDSAAKRVSLFSTGGSLIATLTGSAANPGGTATTLSNPKGIAVDPAGNIWVVDGASNMVQKFGAGGKFALQIGGFGSGNGQFNDPSGIAALASGNVLVTDENSRVQEFRSDGVFVRAFGSGGTGTAQLKEPRGIAVSPKNTAYIADAGNVRIDQWSHASYDPQSGVRSVEVKVDGAVAEKYTPPCVAGSCSVNRQWTLDSKKYASGAHTVEVIARDGVNLAAPAKSLTVTTVNDNTPPQLSVTGGIFSAPQGWIEQKGYGYSATATDAAGYGVVSLALKVDGNVVASTSQSCPNGGCSRTLSGTFNASAYAGGAHAAELVAVDGAGLVTKKAWTMNVDPDGVVSAIEAEDTLEAVDTTSGSEIIAPNLVTIPADERADGNNPSLHPVSGGIESAGTPNLSAIDAEPEDGFSIGLPESTVDVEPATTSGAALQPIIVNQSATVSANTQTHADTILRPVYNGIMSYQAIRDAAGPQTYSWDIILREGQTLKSLGPKDAEIDFADGTPAMTISAEPAHDAVGNTVPTTLSVSEGSVITLKVEHNAQSFVYPVVGGAAWQGIYTTQYVSAPKDAVEIYEEKKKLEEEAIALRESEKWKKWEQEVKEFEEGKGPAYESGTSPYKTKGFDRVGPPIPLPDNNTDDQGASASGSARHRAIGFEYELVAAELPGWLEPFGEVPWVMTHWGTFEYNGNFAWWKESKPHPHCDHDARAAVITLEFCNWIGLNHQPYGAGRHISSQARYRLQPGGLPVDMLEPITEYMYGSGYANGHNTTALCNPLSSC